MVVALAAGGLWWYFHPSFERDDPVVYTRRHGYELGFDTFRPERPNGLGIVVMVSGGWRSGSDNFRPWMAAPLLDGSAPSRRFSVVPPPGEQARLEMDAVDLRSAAQESDGKFYTVETAHRLIGDLPRGRQVRIEALPATPIWNSPWLAGLLVALLLMEWLLRKRLGWM